MDPQGRTVDEVSPGSTSAVHCDTTPNEASARPEPTKEAPKPKASLERALSWPPSSGPRWDPQGWTVDEACPGPTSSRTFVPPSPPCKQPALFPFWESRPSFAPCKNRGKRPPCKTDKVWINGVRMEVNSAQPTDHPERPCTIFRVPEHIRRLNDGAYRPVIASLGPFHHNWWRDSSMRDPEHIRQLDPKAYEPVTASLEPFHDHNWWATSLMNDHKWRCVRHLLSRHQSREHASQLLNECLLELKELDEEVRSCYSEEFSELNAQDMALIMLLDGCFIIYLMLKMCTKKESLIKERKKEKGIAKEIKEEEEGKLEGKATEEDEGKRRRECMIETRGGEVVLNIEEKDKKGKGIAWEIEEEEVVKLEGEATKDVVLNIEEKDEQLEDPTVAGLFTLSLAVYDLLKLENQIPFFIIELLFDHLKACEDEQINLVDLALQLFNGIHPKKSKSFKKKSPGEYHHLLHLFYSSRIPSEKPAKSTSAPEEAAPSQGASTSALTSTSASGWIPELMKCKGKKTEVDPSRGSLTSAPKWVPSATELDRAGVKFEREEQADSFLNIKFQRRKMKLTPLLCFRKLFLMLRSGRMEIPPLQIYDYTIPLFRNLVAFEQCYFDTEMYFTIYALFMDCIIDRAEDVRLLHLRGILEHKLSCDEEVAFLINHLGMQIHYDWEKNYLANQIKEINRFYDFKWHKWLATLRRDYLGNPWATISVLAAVFLLLLTVEQAVFSALSYVHSS